MSTSTAFSPADLSAVPPQPDVPSSYSNWAFRSILHQHFNRLRARLLNLAETSTRDRQQSEAMKGLMKDFVNEAYYPTCHEIEGFLRDKGVIPRGEGQSVDPLPGTHHLTARSMNDILYEPDGV